MHALMTRTNAHELDTHMNNYKNMLTKKCPYFLDALIRIFIPDDKALVFRCRSHVHVGSIADSKYVPVVRREG